MQPRWDQEVAFHPLQAQKRSFNPRANEEDIVQLMYEIILSLRLLFGQQGLSRKMFVQTYIPTKRLIMQDSLLPLLCMYKSPPQASFTLKDQPVYFAAQHFPALAGRIELVASELKSVRPNSMRDLI